MKKIRQSYIKVSTLDTNEVSIDVDGIVRIDKLILVDQDDFKEWEISIKSGEIIIEPFEKSEKRDFKINRIICE